MLHLAVVLSNGKSYGYIPGARVQLSDSDLKVLSAAGAVREITDEKKDKKAPEASGKK